MSKVLVTGGAGFMGSHLADELLNGGHDVVVLDDLSGGFAENVPAAATFIEGSITDEGLIKRVFAEHGFDHVFHLAAYAAEGLSHFIRKFNYENNLIGSINLINAAVNGGVKSFVFTSSIAVYGANQTPMREDMVPQPEDPYGISKLAVEQDLMAAHEMFGMDCVIFRPHNVYGERQNIGDKYRNVIGIFMNQIMQGLPMTIFGDGEQSRAFTHIADVAPAIASAAFDPKAFNQVFNVGSDLPWTVNELAVKVAETMGVEPDIRHLDARNEVVHAFSDHSKLHDVLGFKAAVDLNEGLARMAAWAKEAGAKPGQEFSNIEIEKNLPPSWRK